MIKRKSLVAGLTAGVAFWAAATSAVPLPEPLPGLGGALFAQTSERRNMKLGVWSNYTRQALLPSFSSNFGFRIDVDLGLLASHEHMLYPSFAEAWDSTSSHRLFLEFSQRRLAGRTLSTSESRWLAFNSGTGGTLEQYVFAPGWSGEFDSGARVDVAAVFANQSFASWGLGSDVINQYGRNRFDSLTMAEQSFNGYRIAEQSAGTGLRLGFSSELAPGFEIDAAFQSRIEMDEFQTYRGVFSEPGDFDIPASANVGVVVKASPKSSLSVGIQRVLYSDVNAFTSAGLPDRLLSLLGDGGSPEFRWQDLTVYRLGWRYQQDENWGWAVEYSTSQQPLPTSSLLSDALRSEVAERNLSVGFSRKAGKHGKLEFAASYAPSEYFLGAANLGQTAQLGQDQLEFEMRLIWDL